ncbi:leucine-rich repeat domain-containing protein [Pantoea sp. PNT02]|uniref:leucine-rich repeat domain-containing protein n=1 Tax=Pantoea sp. PNT02 TaxID=2769261 RepID=UPI00177FA8D7|nr:leucine-rich repeat domain-containing protein [Pantoea sp. PNT02]MBD9646308.1 leucine-rich repeat domain-containing protein [Pantoea sp. PNT02]
MTRIVDVMNPGFRAAHPDFHLADLTHKWSQTATDGRSNAEMVSDAVLAAIAHLNNPQNQLHLLELAEMGLYRLPPNVILQRLDGITILDLSDNLIPGEELAKLSSVSSLQQLYLNHNPVQTIPADVLRLQPNLAILGLERCQLEMLPPEVLELAELYTLKLRGNPIQTLPENIGFCLRNLATLDIRDTLITDLPSSLDYLQELVVMR